MKLSKRSCVVVVLGGIAATAAVAVPSGTAQAPGATTLSFYEPDAQSTFKIVDNPPKTFGNRPGPRSRFTIGDKLALSSALFDKKGGTRQGRLYADGTIVKGGTFETAKLLATGTYVLTDGSQISVQGCRFPRTRLCLWSVAPAATRAREATCSARAQRIRLRTR